MASVQKRGDKFQLRVKHKLLPKPFFHTFDEEEQAESYGNQLESMLERGIVPLELLDAKPAHTITLASVITNYLADADVNPAPSDAVLLELLKVEVGGVKVSELTYAWAQAYVGTLKRPTTTRAHLAPGTIRKRVGSLARVLDWHHRKTTGADAVNPLKLLPRGYSTYSARQAEEAGGAKVDVERDRRLSEAELLRVRLALSGVKREGRERALKPDPEFRMIFELIRGTGVRLFEAYRAKPNMFNLEKGWFRVAGSKGHRGAVKPRVVALRPELVAMLGDYLVGRAPDQLMFGFWDGTEEGRGRAKSKLSVRFRVLFEYAQVEDFTEHDLRHSACCDWLETRNAHGGWAFSEIEICKMMGWSNLSMLMRYASLRAEDLASRLG